MVRYGVGGVRAHPQVVLRVVEQEPHLSVGVRQEHLLQGDDVGMLQLPEKLPQTKQEQEHSDVLPINNNIHSRGGQAVTADEDANY